jgi:tetratricopeptide (TPR) repeat protein
MSKTTLGLLLGALALLTPRGSGQDIPAETWARLMVDHPLAAKGDRDRVLGSWLDLIEEEPGHPLVEGTLRLIESQGGVMDDPAGFQARVAEFSPEGMDALARRQLERMAMRAFIGWAPLPWGSQAPQFETYLDEYAVLGPLGPVGNPLAFSEPPAQLRDPGFERAHAGVDGEVRWQSVMRHRYGPYVMANAALSDNSGWALVAARFDVTEGGPAWLEIDAVPGGGPGFPFSGTSRVASRGTPSYAFSLNGEEPVIVERMSRETGAVRRQAVTLHTGRNRIVLHGALDSGVSFAVRVLGSDGRVYPGLSQPGPDAPLVATPLGAPVDVAPPSEPLSDSEAWLLRQSGLDRSADLLALAGVLAFVDGREAEGLARVRDAVELEPTRVGLRAMLSRLTSNAGYLPSVWKRNRSRALDEQVYAAQPDHLSVGLNLARILADEDREEESIARLLELTLTHQRQSRTLLGLHTVYSKLDMDVAAEQALLDALERTPDNPVVLGRLAGQQLGQGRTQAWSETAERALAAGGRTASNLRSLANQFANEGLTERSKKMFNLAVTLDDAGFTRLAHARMLGKFDQMPRAHAQAEELVSRFPGWEQPHLLRADLFHRQGNTDQELVQLHAALERRPSMREARDRVQELTGSDPTEAFYERFMLDADAIRAAWDDRDSEDSVVKLIDHQIVMVFADGSVERVTQDVFQARDLAGCGQLGELRVSGESIEVATIKADGSVFEPVRIGNSYVMPSLEPGDFVVQTSRQFRSAPSNGVVRVGSWRFASTRHPYEVSRFVISVPNDLPLRMELRNGAQEVDRIPGPDATIHVFEVHGQARILTQPGTPPEEWFVPVVDFGMDADEGTILAQLAATVLQPTRVTPEIREAAAGALSEAGDPTGDEQRARVLHRFTNDTLDQRVNYDATQSLIAREGSGVWLYSALLQAADVPHEIVWSRNIAPGADLAPAPAFVAPGYWRRKLLVLVQPRDGEPAWCDMDVKTMPYGEMMGDATGAPAVAVPSMRKLTLPELPLEEQPGMLLALGLALEADGSARLEGSAEIRGGYGFMAKEIIRDIPEQYRRLAINATASQILPGASVHEFEFPGLEEEDQRVGIRITGEVDALLDDDGVSLGCRLPYPPAEMESNLAGGDGERRLPYVQRATQIESTIVRMEWPAELEILELPQGLDVSYGECSFHLVVARDGDRAVTIQRDLVIKPFSIEPAGYAEFVAFCKRIDEVERGRLKFTRREAPGDVDRAVVPR